MTARREWAAQEHPLPMTSRCRLLRVTRSTVYYEPQGDSAEDLAFKRAIDELHLQHPAYGSRMLAAALRRQGHGVNRKRVQRLMREMGLESLAPKPSTSTPRVEHLKYPYLLRKLKVVRANQAWAADITYIPLTHGYAYLVAIIDWYSRKVLAWRLSNTMESSFCVAAYEEAVVRFGVPEIFNSDQGSQFTDERFTAVSKKNGTSISMDGVGRCMDNIFVERLWRSLKYEDVYLKHYSEFDEARTGIDAYLKHFNGERPHSALLHSTPDEFYYMSRMAQTRLSTA